MRTPTQSTALTHPEGAHGHLQDVALRIHQTAFELLAMAHFAQKLLKDLPPSVVAILEGGAEAAALIAQLSCQLQLELGDAEDVGPDPPVSQSRVVTDHFENLHSRRKR